MEPHAEAAVEFKTCERKTCTTEKANFIVNSEGNSNSVLFCSFFFFYGMDFRYTLRQCILSTNLTF